MRTRFLASTLALAGAIPLACTFGADDFKLVPAGSAGSGNSGASTGGGSSGGGPGAPAGGDANPGDAGAGGVGTPGVTFSCATRTQPLTVFTAAQLSGFKPERLDLVSGGPKSAFAIAVASSPEMGGGSTSSVVVGRISDSGNNPIGKWKAFTPMGHFTYGGAQALANQLGTQLDVIGADQRGVIDVVFQLDPNGNFVGDPSVVPLDTPVACASTGMGFVRDLRASFDTTLSYVVTCAQQNDTMWSLWLSRDRGVAEEIVDAMSSPDTRIVRQYLHTAAAELIVTGSDGPEPAVPLRFGKTTAALSKLQLMKTSADASVYQNALFVPLADHSGTFMVEAQLHDPTSGKPVTPVSILGGTFTSANFASLLTTPPPGLTLMATYDKADAVVFPNDGVARDSGDVFLIGFQPLSKAGIYSWMVDSKGRTLSPQLALYEKKSDQDALADQPHGALVGAGYFVAWVAEGAETTVMGRSVGCF